MINRNEELNKMKWIIDRPKFTRDIDKFTEEYINYITNNYNNLKKNQSLIKTISPSDIRGDDWYDYLFDELDKKEQENNEETESVDKAIKDLDNVKKMLNEIRTIIDDTKLFINKYQIGTLQGISRQAVYKNENQITPDEIAQEVINQPYNEIEDIKGGRKKKIIRTKKKKFNKRKSKRINKYK